MSNMTSTPTLSPERQRFVDEYAVDTNGAQAAIRAGYSPRSAKVTASRLLADANVQQAVAERTLALAEQAGVSAEWVVLKLRTLALGAAKDSDRIRALELLGRHLGMFKDVNVHVNIRDPRFEGLSREGFDAILAAYASPAIDGEARILEDDNAA